MKHTNVGSGRASIVARSQTHNGNRFSRKASAPTRVVVAGPGFPVEVAAYLGNPHAGTMEKRLPSTRAPRPTARA